MWILGNILILGSVILFLMSWQAAVPVLAVFISIVILILGIACRRSGTH